jgi:hypothetical protein
MSNYVHIPQHPTDAPRLNFDDKSFGRSQRWTTGEDATPFWSPTGEKRQRVSKADAYRSMWDTTPTQKVSKGIDAQYDVEVRDFYEQWDDWTQSNTQVVMTRMRNADLYP